MDGVQISPSSIASSQLQPNSIGSVKSSGVGSSNIEEHVFNDWTISCRKNHILPSKCLGDCNEAEPCIYCNFTKELNVPHLPEMVFPYNILELKHKTGCLIQFTAIEALKLVKKENQNLKIACSDAWKKARADTGITDKPVENFDWTFRTDYSGTYSGWPTSQVSETGIDLEILKKREQILLYRELMLFDDELHDNGVAVCSVRIRVMPSGFFILLRYFLRVDGVMIFVNDTRLYHDFTTNFVLVESAQRENTVEELKVPLGVMNEPDEITPLLTLRKTICEKFVFPN